MMNTARSAIRPIERRKRSRPASWKSASSSSSSSSATSASVSASDFAEARIKVAISTARDRRARLYRSCARAVAAASVAVAAGATWDFASAAPDVDADVNVIGGGRRGGGRRRFPAYLGSEDQSVRDEVHRIDSGESGGVGTEYRRTGVLGDPRHRVEYDNHPFDRFSVEEERASSSSSSSSSSGRRKNEGGERTARRGRRRTDSKVRVHRAEEGEGGGDSAVMVVVEGGPTDSLPEIDVPSSTANGDVDLSPFRPLRFRFETASLDAVRNSLNSGKIDAIKEQVLPRMSEFWSSALSVVPVKDRLRISSADLTDRRYCGDADFSEVPSHHISDGVPDTDLLLYVSGRPSPRFCGKSTLAVAVACNFDQYDRPTAGAINFCLEQIDVVPADGEDSGGKIVPPPWWMIWWTSPCTRRPTSWECRPTRFGSSAIPIPESPGRCDRSCSPRWCVSTVLSARSCFRTRTPCGSTTILAEGGGVTPL